MTPDYKKLYHDILLENSKIELDSKDQKNLERDEGILAKWLVVAAVILQLTINLGSLALAFGGKIEGNIFMGIIMGTNPLTAMFVIIRIMVSKNNGNAVVD